MLRIAFIASGAGPAGAARDFPSPPGDAPGRAADAAAPSNDNRQRLSRAFAAGGWQVSLCGWETLRLTTDGAAAQGPSGAWFPLAGFNLIWLVGLGPRQGFLDRVQMLRTLPQERFVNSPDALALLHGKLALLEFAPETHVGSDAADLLRIVASGGRWVAKPLAGSFGRDVYLLCGDGAETRAVLERLTAAGECCLLQRYAPQAETSEKRVLVAGGAIVGAYAKAGGNLAAGGTARPATLDERERGLALQVAKRLRDQGARFAGIDLAWPSVFEANIANPGGLSTLERLTGANLAPDVVSALTAWRNERSSHDGRGLE